VNSRMEVAAGSARRVGYRWRYLLALAVALALGFGVAMPVFADDKGGIQPEVVGGEPVPDGKYRFMTSIQADLSGRPPYKEHFCGGTLIDRNSVLTAAHCVVFFGQQTDEDTLGYRDVRLDVGVTVLSSDQGQPRRIDRLSDVSIHPDYNGNRNSKYDAAVIKLSNPVSIQPIALASPASGNQLETPPGSAIVAGWGDTRPQPPGGGAPSEFPRRMQEATPPLVSDAECERSYRGNFYGSIMVCAGKTAEDTCQGDSGGPLFVTRSGVRRQIGITSFGNGCGAPGFPGVYTEVNAASIYNFIQRAAAR
jgi:secreted trypsin-like serine protease